MATRGKPTIATRPLWTCPRCGNKFVTRNIWHSCVTVPLDDHFIGRPRARQLFDRYLAAVESLGPVTVVSSMSRIAFMTRVRFGGCQVRKDWLLAAFWLVREVRSARFTNVERLGPKVWLYHLAIRDESDLDAEFMSWMAEARLIGDQEHLGGVLDTQLAGSGK
jgi:hypothetical protein